jgi:hypothetical protein
LKSLNKLKEINLLGRDIAAHYRGILPVLKNSFSRCVILTQFAKDDDNSSEVQEPTIDQLEPFILLNFEVDGPDIAQELSILLDERELDRIIDSLTESKRRIARLKKSIAGIV